MELDFEKALTYISKDSGWANKLLAGSGIVLAVCAVFIIPFVAYIFTLSKVAGLASFLLCFIFSILLSLLLAGYFVQTGNRRINYSNTFLPDWSEFGRMMKTGLKYFVGLFIYSLPVILLSVIFLVCLLFVIGNNAFHPAAFLLLTLLGAFSLLVYILTVVFCPLMMANFFKELKILAFVNFNNAFDMLKGNVGNYCILLLLFLALSVLTQIVISILGVTIVGIIFIPVLYFYTYLVAAELTAQFVLCAKEKAINAQSAE